MSISLCSFFEGINIFTFHYDYSTNNENPLQCKIRVGPRRFIDMKLDSEHCTVDLMCNNREVFITNHPVEFERKGDVLIFDADKFLKSMNATFRYCDSEHFKSRKRFLYFSYIISESWELGLYTYDWSRTDDGFSYISLYFKNGAFAVDHRPIRRISLRAFSDGNPFRGNMRDSVISVLNEPHDLNGSELERILSIDKIMGLDYLSIELEDGFICLDRKLEKVGKEHHYCFGVSVGSHSSGQTVDLPEKLYELQDVRRELTRLLSADLESLIAKGKLLGY